MSGINVRNLRSRPGRRSVPIWAALISVVMTQAIGFADVFSVDAEPLRLRGEFMIGKEGRLILLPVEVSGETHLFMLDTGACCSGIDISLTRVLGKPAGKRLLQTPGGAKTVEVFDWPDATLGGQPLKSGLPVARFDFTEMRQAMNEKIFGVIGMDILSRCRLQIDFDRGLLRFLESLPRQTAELGTRIPIELSDGCAPFLTGTLDGFSSERFLIDTGAHGNSIQSELFDQLLERKQIRLGSSFTSITVAGEVQGNRGTLNSLSIGPITREGLRVSRVNVSSLGLRYFSRFLVTFDFPDSAVYLRAGANAFKDEPRATSGMTLSWSDGKAVVTSVKKQGSAAKAGVQPKDVFVTVDGKSAEKYDHFALRQLLTSEGGRKVPLQISRSGRIIDVELVLDED